MVHRTSRFPALVRTLQGISQINIVPCAGRKTALFYGPILIIQHLVKEGIPFKVRGRPPPKKPVMLVVGPLVELQNSQVSEMKEVGVKAVAVNAESLQMHGRKLFDQIQRCEWSVVLLSPERLTSKELDIILRDQEFRRNVIGLGLDELHVYESWGDALGKLRLFAHERWKSLDRSVARFLHQTLSGLTEMLDSLMEGWEYLERDGAGLFDLIDGLNTRYDERRRHSKVISAQKAARTRARKKAKLVADKAAQASPVLDARAPSSPPPPPATSDAIPHQFHPLDLAIPPATPYTPTRASRRRVSPSPCSHSRSQSMTLNEYGGSSESAFYRPDWPGLPEVNAFAPAPAPVQTELLQQYNQPYRVAMPESPRLATRSQLAAYSTRSPLTPRRSRTANYFSGYILMFTFAKAHDRTAATSGHRESAACQCEREQADTCRFR
ncbi:hypothetical protein BV25DRAFT_1843340 [Artomyces pyxidatus]|uniref:Uncharacterized protein n=1 Tax=Artomyces pyxidatus TaxID=48021 RepID=A0ACB8SGQ9_9AGAM|nr:hypothetical protein BV25DRAFT_1843340 [Artomyces pyxidatus]